MAVRIQFRRGTAAEWVSANPTLAAGELGYESDTGAFKIGNGSDDWANLLYGAVSESYIDNAIANVIDLAPGALDTLNELAAAINDDANFFSTINNNIANAEANAQAYTTDQINAFSDLTTGIHGISDTTQLVFQDQMTNTIANSLTGYATQVYVSNAVGTHNSDTTDVHGIANTANLVTVSQLGPEIDNAIADFNTQTLNVHGITNTAVLVTNSDLVAHTDATTTVHGIANTAELVTNSSLANTLGDYAELNSPTFTGNVSLPNTVTIGDISYTELSYLNNASSNIQDQLDAKLGTSSAESIYAKLDGAIFTGNVVLTANTSIGLVSSIELSYLDGVTSAIQTQLDAKAPTANPTFTGTVSGVTKSHVGLGSVDNTSDADKPISTATQTALDAKLGLAGGTMTGKITLDGDPTQDQHAATKQYVDNISAGLHVHEAAHAATPDTLANLVSSTVTYDNGTNGVGATLTLGANLTVLDGHTLNNGDRILVKNEATAAHNGIYVRTSATVLTRADDFNSAAEIAGGDFVFVENGTLYNSTGWVVENEVTTVGTDAVLWLQFSGAGTITAGNNISVSGTQVSVVSSPTFTNVVANTITANTGFRFADNTVQTSAGVPSLTQFVEKTSNFTLDSLVLIDEVLEVNSSSATTITIPANADLAWPVGASMDILQTNTGQVTVAGAAGVTVNATPGLKLRTRWSSCTIMKRATNTWIVYGDLTA